MGSSQEVVTDRAPTAAGEFIADGDPRSSTIGRSSPVMTGPSARRSQLAPRIVA